MQRILELVFGTRILGVRVQVLGDRLRMSFDPPRPRLIKRSNVVRPEPVMLDAILAIEPGFRFWREIEVFPCSTSASIMRRVGRAHACRPVL